MNTTKKKHPTIKTTPVKSSQIHAIGHDPVTNTLAIQFKGKDDKPGSIYHYQNFSEEDFKKLSAAESIGSHFGKHIKPHDKKHPYTKVA